MIEVIKQELQKFKGREDKFNHLRELLQILILRIIYDAGFFKNIIFTGGTALRILFNLRRFSEDLDFSLVNKESYSLDKFYNVLKKTLYQYNFKVEIKIKDKKIVQEAHIKFKDILFDTKITDLSAQKLFIKIEIDNNPPKGGNIEVSLINKLFIFSITHFDLASLYATKLHACFFRRYTKGRDFYDLIWYLTKRIEPNYVLLNNAIKQTYKDKFMPVNKNNFKEFLLEKISRIDFKEVRQDVKVFLENKDELKLLDEKVIIGLIKKSTKI
jgi:predicted nucleotidyltransferase component of viral defense system